MNVDDVGSAFTIDIYLRIYWIDPRININSIFGNGINPEVNTEGFLLPNMYHYYFLFRYFIIKCVGIDITNYIRNPNNALSFWLPDIVFYSITDSSQIVEFVKIFPNCKL